jgi:hypothetical protein
MRLMAHIAAFAIIVLSGYLLVTYGYPNFFSRTRSHVIAQVLTFCALAGTTGVMIWATRKIP